MENTLVEDWKDIPGYTGLYQASTFGRIKSMDRVIIPGRYKTERQLFGNIMLQYDEKSGYKTICIAQNGKSKKFLVHRLILITFKGESDLNVCNHIDGNKANNRLDNLEWCDMGYNTRHAFANNLAKGRFNQDNNFVVHSDDAIRKVKQHLADGCGDVETERLTGISRHTIKSIRIGKARTKITLTT